MKKYEEINIEIEKFYTESIMDVSTEIDEGDLGGNGTDIGYPKQKATHLQTLR